MFSLNGSSLYDSSSSDLSILFNTFLYDLSASSASSSEGSAFDSFSCASAISSLRFSGFFFASAASFSACSS